MRRQTRKGCPGYVVLERYHIIEMVYLGLSLVPLHLAKVLTLHSLDLFLVCVRAYTRVNIKSMFYLDFLLILPLL